MIVNDKTTNISAQINMTTYQSVITLTGNANNWFGIPFDAQ